MVNASDFMGDDENGNCLGCGWPIDRFNASCPVCLAVVETLREWSTTGVDPERAEKRLQAALAESLDRKRAEHLGSAP